VNCSQCVKPVAKDKGFTVSYYKGKDEKSYKCCSVACVDKLIKGKNANRSKASL
jgi:hypothetical protein